jgi:hypothetical protein
MDKRLHDLPRKRGLGQICVILNANILNSFQDAQMDLQANRSFQEKFSMERPGSRKCRRGALPN